jgi:hypothetical protein
MQHPRPNFFMVSTIAQKAPQKIGEFFYSFIVGVEVSFVLLALGSPKTI